MVFTDIIGKEVLFYGVDNYYFKIDGHVFEVVEDPDDGYRSYLGSIETAYEKGIFFRDPIAIVSVEEETDPDRTGYYLIDEDQHVWLSFGTGDSDSYYPCFYFNYTPKPPSESKPKPKEVRSTYDVDPFDRLFDQRDC